MTSVALRSCGPTIALFGHFGAGNWGNEATLRACLENVRRLRPGARIICLSTNPADTVQRYGAETVGILDIRRDMHDVRDKRRSKLMRLVGLVAAQPINLLAMLRVLRKADALVMTGTGMITDWGEGPLGLPLSMWQWSTMASLLGCRVTFLSVGVERIDHPIAARLLRRALALADYRSFRDEHSRQQLANAGVSGVEASVYPDLAFSLPVACGAADRRRPGTVAVGVFCHRSRGAANAADKAEYHAYLEKLGRFVLFLQSRGKRVRLIIGDRSDVAVIDDLKTWLAPQFPAPYASEPAESVEQVLEQLAESELVVATRYHNVLLALHLGIPTLSIGYEGKNDALMEQAGLGDFCQPIEGLDEAKLERQFLRLEAEAEQIARTIVLKTAGFRRKLEQQYVDVFGAGGLIEQRGRYAETSDRRKASPSDGTPPASPEHEAKSERLPSRVSLEN